LQYTAADYTLIDDAISFGEPGPTTMMFCGEGEKSILDMMRKINKCSITKRKIKPDGKYYNYDV
jgi:hypothetical protein